MKYIKILIIFTIVSSLTSCSDMMEVYNPNELTVDEAWESLDDAKNSISSVYNALYDDDLMSIEKLSLCSDMGYPGYGRNGNPTNATLAMYYNQTYTNSASSISDNWSALYTGIFRANQTIEGLETLSKNGLEESDTWREYMGQARFFRGVFHFWLNSLYNNGEVIIFDSVPKDKEDYYKSVSSSDSVQNFFRKDLKYAYENLPSSWDSDGERVTKGTAAAMLGQSYLYTEEYDSAKYYLKDVIDSGVYSLVTNNVDSMFTTYGEFNSESIFEINYSTGIHPELSTWSNNATTNLLGRTGTTSSFTLPCWLAHAYQTEVMDSTDSRNFIYYIDENGEEKDSIRSMPLRGSAMVATVQEDNISWYLNQYTSVSVSINAKSAIGYYRKYCNWDIVSNEKDLPDGSNKSGKNVVVCRLADVYLMYAECLIRQDDPDIEGALNYMNKIRNRWALQLLGTAEQNPDWDANSYFNGVTYTAETSYSKSF